MAIQCVFVGERGRAITGRHRSLGVYADTHQY